MASAIESKALLAQSRVQGWHTSVSDAETRSVVSRLCLECTATLKALLQPLATRTDQPRSIIRIYKRICSAFTLWVDGYDIHAGGIDKPLGASWVLRKLMYQLLTSACDLLTEELVPALNLCDALSARVSALRNIAAEAREVLEDGSQEHAEEGDDSSDEDGGSTSGESCTLRLRNLDEILKDLANDVQCLQDLNPLIEAPLRPPPIEKGKSTVREVALVHWSPHQLYGDRISRRFPQAHCGLVERLAKANLARFQRMQEFKQMVALAKEEEAEVRDGPNAIVNDAVTVSKFDDSGLGPSIATRSSYADTVMHYEKDGGHIVRIPRLPDRARAGESFECLACGRVLFVKSNKAWKKHLYHDLRPWMCLDPACDDGGEPFASRQNWEQHLAIDHGLEGRWTTFDCLLCGEPTGDGKIAVCQHLATHVEEISLAALPAGEDSDNGFDDESDGDEHCGHSKTFSCPTCHTTFRDEIALQKHIKAKHIRPFTCIFQFAGCPSSYPSKNEWKRHVIHRHVVLTYWLCTQGTCGRRANPAPQPRHTGLAQASGAPASSAPLPNGNIFNRKDLYTQHVRRMHVYPAASEWEDKIRGLQAEAIRTRCQLPTHMKCPSPTCAEEFWGVSAWDDRMEHVAGHLERDSEGTEPVVRFGGDADPTLTAWAESPEVGVVRKTGEGKWELVDRFQGSRKGVVYEEKH